MKQLRCGKRRYRLASHFSWTGQFVLWPFCFVTSHEESLCTTRKLRGKTQRYMKLSPFLKVHHQITNERRQLSWDDMETVDTPHVTTCVVGPGAITTSYRVDVNYSWTEQTIGCISKAVCIAFTYSQVEYGR